MALVVEDGTGLADAESYASVAQIDDWWTKRPHDPRSALWLDAANTTAMREGAARETTRWIDDQFGLWFVGTRLTATQALEWPRTSGPDENGDPLPAVDIFGVELPPIPVELIAAVCELAVMTRRGGGGLGALVQDGTTAKTAMEKAGDVQVQHFVTGTTAGQAIRTRIRKMLRRLLQAEWIFR